MVPDAMLFMVWGVMVVMVPDAILYMVWVVMVVVVSHHGCQCYRCCCCQQCCCGKPRTSDYTLNDNCCQCNVVALKKISGIPDMDLVYVTYHVDVCIFFIFSITLLSYIFCCIFFMGIENKITKAFKIPIKLVYPFKTYMHVLYEEIVNTWTSVR